MNLLTSPLPSCVDVNGKQVEIRTDYRLWLRVSEDMESNEWTRGEKLEIFLRSVYPTPPRDAVASIQAAQWFMNGGREYKADTTPRVVSFEKDAPLIYAAFRQTHGIDLTNAELHWWQFLALMQGLDGESNFRQLVDLRSRVASGKATKEERRAARELGELFEIEDVDDRSLEEKEAEARFWALVEEGERKRRGK